MLKPHLDTIEAVLVQRRWDIRNCATPDEPENIDALVEIDAALAAVHEQMQRPPDAPQLVNEYQIEGGGPIDADDITLRRMQQRKGPDKWAIYNRGSVLSRKGEWEYEPLPSSRTDAYLRRCRFDTLQEALGLYRELQRRPSREEADVCESAK